MGCGRPECFAEGNHEHGASTKITNTPRSAEDVAKELYDYLQLQFDEDPTLDMIETGERRIFQKASTIVP